MFEKAITTQARYKDVYEKNDLLKFHYLWFHIKQRSFSFIIRFKFFFFRRLVVVSVCHKRV